MKSNSSLFLVSLSLVALGGCLSDRTDQTKFEILPYLSPCVGAAPQACMVVSENDGVHKMFYDRIEGFDFKWGEMATIKVEKAHVSNPPQGGSFIRYQAVEVLSRIRIHVTAFNAAVPPGSAIEVRDEMLSIEGYEKPIRIPAGMQVPGLDSGRTQKGLDMEILMDESAELTLKSIKEQG